MTINAFLDRPSLLPLIDKWRQQGDKIGFTSGAFDLLHQGHISYLNQAKNLCDRLVVAVNQDASIRKYKSTRRPIVGEKERVQLVANLKAVDAAFLFPELNNQENILAIRPNYYIKGGDYQLDQLSSAPYLKEWGGEVKTVPFETGYSTSALIASILPKYHDQLPRSYPPPPQTPSPAIFLDRDGVINREIEYLHDPEEFVLFPEVIDSLKKFLERGYKLVVVTNQAGIGLGYFTKEDFFKVNKKMLTLFKQNQIIVDKVYYCPHSLGEHCACRKPGTLLLERAIEDLNLIPAESFMIGDKTSDILAGERIGVQTILVNTGHGGKDQEYPVVPDFQAQHLGEACDWILKQKPPVKK